MRGPEWAPCPHAGPLAALCGLLDLGGPCAAAGVSLLCPVRPPTGEMRTWDTWNLEGVWLTAQPQSGSPCFASGSCQGEALGHGAEPRPAGGVLALGRWLDMLEPQLSHLENGDHNKAGGGEGASHAGALWILGHVHALQ